MYQTIENHQNYYDRDVVDREALYNALCLPWYVESYKEKLANHEYGEGHVYESAEELQSRLRTDEGRLARVHALIQRTIDDAIDRSAAPILHDPTASRRLIAAIRYLRNCYCHSEDAPGLFFAVDIMQHQSAYSVWAYLEITPEGLCVRNLYVDCASQPGEEIRTGRILRSFGAHITWSRSYERLVVDQYPLTGREPRQRILLQRKTCND